MSDTTNTDLQRARNAYLLGQLTTDLLNAGYGVISADAVQALLVLEMPTMAVPLDGSSPTRVTLILDELIEVAPPD